MTSPTTTIPPEVIHAISVAILAYHKTAREHELLAHAFADCEVRLHACQRDLHELARILEAMSGQAVSAAELVSAAVGAGAGTVTMPVIKGESEVSQGERPASEIVLDILQHQRLGGFGGGG